MSKRKITSIQKELLKGNAPNEKQTHNVSINVENTNGTNKGGYLLFVNKPRAVHEEQKGYPKGTRSTHPQREDAETKKCCFGTD